MPVGLQAKKQYLEEELAGLSPVQLLIKLYDVAIASCARGDQQRLNSALAELIRSLNFEHAEIALGSFRLYNYCLRQSRAGRYGEVKKILAGLRDTWVQAERKMRRENALHTAGADARSAG